MESRDTHGPLHRFSFSTLASGSCDHATDSPCVHSLSFQAEGNKLYAQGKYVKAMTKYTEVGGRVSTELGHVCSDGNFIRLTARGIFSS